MEEPLPPEQQQAPQNYPIVNYEQLNPQFAQWSLDADVALSNLEHYMRGEIAEVNEGSGRVSWKPRYKELLNDQGISEVMTFLRGFVSKFIILSNVEKDQARRDIKINATGLAKILYINHRRYELKMEKYDLLCLMITNFIEYTVYRAVNKTTLQVINPQSKEQILTSRTDSSMQPQKKSPLSFIFG